MNKSRKRPTKEERKVYYEANKPRLNRLQRERAAELKQQVYHAYGNRCECCGESEVRFLQVDHVFGGGAAHRREMFNGGRTGNITVLYRHILKLGCPDLYQLLCANCNWGRRRTGVCPHEEVQ